MRTGRSLVTSLALAALVVAGCSSGGAVATPAAASPAPTPAGPDISAPHAASAAPGATGTAWATGQSLCVLLGPGDFAGIPGVAAPQDNSDAPGDDYCTYVAGKSGAQGGVEFDAFAGTDAAGTYQTVLGEVGPGAVDAALPGADASVIAVAPPDGSAFIVVRKGNLVFTISIPQGPQAETLLRSLAGLVLERGAAAIG